MSIKLLKFWIKFGNVTIICVNFFSLFEDDDSFDSDSDEEYDYFSSSNEHINFLPPE